MKAYISIFKVRLKTNMQYQIAAWAGIATQFFFGFIFIMIYKAFYDSSNSEMPITIDQVVSYIWLQQAFLVFIMLWYRDTELANLIITGNISYELSRPIELYWMWYAKLVAQRVAGAMLRCLPILIIAFILPAGYRIMLPESVISLLLFILSLVLGLCLVVSISMLIYISMFKTLSIGGSMLMFCTLGEFFAGMIIPIPLMPSWIKPLVYVLPFRYTTDLPFRIYSGNIPVNEALIEIIIQIAWLVLLICSGRIILKRILHKIIVQGG